MDLWCPVCGEPWDMDELHEIAREQSTTFDDVSARFSKVGCKALDTGHGTPSTEVDPRFGLTRAEAARATYDILGDDVDGAATSLEDMGF